MRAIIPFNKHLLQGQCKKVLRLILLPLHLANLVHALEPYYLI